MEVTSVNVEQANVQLDKARHYQVCCGKLISTCTKAMLLEVLQLCQYHLQYACDRFDFWNLTCHLQDT